MCDLTDNLSYSPRHCHYPSNMLFESAVRRPLKFRLEDETLSPQHVKQIVEVMETSKRFDRFVEVLRTEWKEGLVIVFVSSNDTAEALVDRLRECRFDECDYFHSGRDQGTRDKLIADYRNGTGSKILVCTSVLSRGLDVPAISIVINYEAPAGYEDYVHRCGRTGRAGRQGVAYTFITLKEETMLQS